MNFVPETGVQRNSTHITYSEILANEMPNIKDFAAILDYLAQSNAPVCNYLFGVMLDRIKHSPRYGETNLEVMLNMSSPGKGHASPFNNVKQSIRNYHLKRAILLLETEQKCSSVNAACVLLSKKMKAFRTSFKLIKAGNREIKSDLEYILFEVYSIDSDPPESKDGLYRIFLNTVLPK